MRRLLFLAFVLCTALAYGGEVSWTLPTTYIDNTSIAPGDLATMETHIFKGDAVTGPWAEFASVSGGATVYVVPGTFERQKYYTVTGGWGTNQSDYAVPFFYARGKSNPPGAVGVK